MSGVERQEGQATAKAAQIFIVGVPRVDSASLVPKKKRACEEVYAKKLHAARSSYANWNT
jgi:hypothetical protein